ncbi:MAG: ECF-type riboflavin transporter substrate-binding protein [Victivallales bacterium]|nr:ECF-type riboflavin transporter substrate-binding protein [Victivallales bacterium]
MIKNPLDFSTRTVVTISIGAALYGIIGLIGIPIGPNVQIRPSILILTVYSVFFGPVVGFFAGFFGHILTDLLAGWGLWWNWELSSGIYGFCAGTVCLFKGFDVKYGLYKVWHIVFFIITTVSGFFAAYLFAGFLDIVLMGEPPRKIIYQVCIISLTNSIVFLCFTVPVIVGFLRTNKKNSNLEIED